MHKNEEDKIKKAVIEKEITCTCVLTKHFLDRRSADVCTKRIRTKMYKTEDVEARVLKSRLCLCQSAICMCVSFSLSHLHTHSHTKLDICPLSNLFSISPVSLCVCMKIAHHTRIQVLNWFN